MNSKRITKNALLLLNMPGNCVNMSLIMVVHDTSHAFMSLCFIGRLFELKNDYVQLEISEKTKMKFLIPTTYGPGVITTGLIDHLVISHNKFIRLCRKFVEDSLKKYNICTSIILVKFIPQELVVAKP